MAKTPEFDLRDNSFKNYIINGNFDFWQRGSSSSTTSGYVADRWYVGNNATTPVCQRSTDVPSNGISKYSCNLTGTVGASQRIFLEQRVEARNARMVYNQKITLSFWYKIAATNLDTNTANSGIYLYSAASEDSTYSTLVEAISLSSLVLDGTWRKATLTFNTLPSGVQNGFSVFLYFKRTSAGSTDAWDMKFTQIMLNEGVEAAPFVRAGRDIAGELELCQRYYEKNFLLDTTPAHGVSYTLASWMFMTGTNPGGQLMSDIDFKVRKRATPTVATYGSNNSTNTHWRYTTGATASVSNNATRPTVWGTRETGVTLESADAWTQPPLVAIFWTADAEL